MVGLFRPAVEYRWICMRVVLIDMGRVLCSDRKSDPSADLQGEEQKMIMRNNKTLSNILSPFYYMIIGSKDILPPYHYINKLHYT